MYQISNLVSIITQRTHFRFRAGRLELHVGAFLYLYLCICRWEICSSWTARQRRRTLLLSFAGRSIRRRQGPSKVLQCICTVVYLSIFQFIKTFLFVLMWICSTIFCDPEKETRPCRSSYYLASLNVVSLQVSQDDYTFRETLSHGRKLWVTRIGRRKTKETKQT